MDAIAIIRLIGSEFESVSDEQLRSWIELVKPLVSKKKFGALYDQAIAYLVCHKMKLTGFGGNEGGGSGMSSMTNVGTMFGVSSISDGGTSVSFNGNQGNLLSTNAEYALTSYGAQYLQLFRMSIIPITISGGCYDA